MTDLPEDVRQRLISIRTRKAARQMWLTNAAAFVVAVFGFIGSRLAEEPWNEISRDIGMAFGIAAIVTITYEGYARQRAAAETMEDLLGKIVDDIVETRTWEEMRQQILEKTAVRRSMTMQMSLRNDATLPTGQRVLFVDSGYRLASLRSHVQEVTVLHFLDSYMRKKASPMPRFTQIMIDGDAVDLSTVGDRFETKVTLPARGSADVPVSIQREEIVHIPGAYTVIMSELTELESITMVDLPKDVEVQANCIFDEPFLKPGIAMHPGRVLLPGQCVEIRFRIREADC